MSVSESEESVSDDWNPQEIAAVSLLLLLVQFGHVTVAVAVADAVTIGCHYYYY